MKWDEMNGSYNNSCLESDVDLPMVAVVIPEVVAIVCSIVGFAGNFLTILMILSSSKLRQITNNWFVCNLSVVDTLYCAFALPIQASIYHNREHPWQDERLCVWLAGLKYSVFGTSLLTLCAIAFNRYIHVVHSKLQPKLFKRYLVVITIVLCWMVPFSLNMTAVIGVWGNFGFQPRALTCAFTISNLDSSVKSHRLVIYISGLGVPILFMGYCYTRIGFVVYRSQRRVQTWASTSQQTSCQVPNTTKRQGSALQLTKTMMIICAIFVICVAPYGLLGNFDPNITCPECHLLTPMLSWIQISLNPIIYTMTNSQFHEAYISLGLWLTCGIRQLENDIRAPTVPSDTHRKIQENK